MQIAALQDANAQAASARSRLYLLLACVFAFPDEEIHESVRDGSLAGSPFLGSERTPCGRIVIVLAC